MQCSATIVIDVGHGDTAVTQCELDLNHVGLHQFTSLASDRQVLQWLS